MTAITAIPAIQGSIDISNEPVLSKEAICYYYDRLDEFVDENIIYPAKRFIPGLEMAPDQRRLLKAISKYERVGVESGHGCHGIDTPIMMFDGSIKKVQNVAVGDALMGGDGQSPRTVLSLARGTEEMYLIKYFSGDEYTVNRSHMLALVASQSHGLQVRGKKTTVSVDEYLSWSERRRRTNIGYKTKVAFAEKSLRIDPYVFGTWLGDGHSSGSAVTTADSEVVEAWRKEANSRGLYFEKREDRGKASTWKISQKYGHLFKNTFSKDLKYYKAKGNKHIPFDYKTCSMPQRLELLAGIVDTDGGLESGGAAYTVIQKRKRLAEDIVFVARSVGCHASMSKVKKKCCNNGVVGTYYAVHITRNVEIIPVRIPYKRANAARNRQRNNLHFGFEVIPLGVGDYYGFNIDGDGLYLLGDFTVTHNTGKSASFSWAVIAYLCTRYNTLGMPVKVPCIAPTHHQLYDVLWPEVKRWLAMSRLRPLLTVNSEELWYNGAKDMCFARSRSVVKSENLQGFHAPHLLWVCDEAFGITRMELWETIEGSLTEDDNKILFGGQHSVIVGYCHDAFHKDRAAWGDPHGCLLRFNSEKSPLAKPEYAMRIARKYGRNSDVYRVRVLGTEPKGNPDAFIQLQDVEAARNRQVAGSGTIEMGVDCAAKGDDLFVVQTRYGHHFYPSFSLPSTDTDQMYNAVVQELRKYRKLTGVTTTARIKIDNTGGWGAGLVDRLLKNSVDNIEVIPVTFGIDTGDKEYADNISVMWGEAKEMIPYCEIEDHDRAEFLVEQLCTRRFDLDKHGRIKIESKKIYKKDYETSPDDADAFVLCASHKAAPKRVFPYYHSTDARDYHGFTIPWESIEPAKSCVFVVLVADKDMGIYGALYFWGRDSHRLLQYDEICEPNPTAKRVADAIKKKCGCRYSDLKDGQQFITRIFGNKVIFDKSKDFAYYMRKEGLVLHKAAAYNIEGALVECNKMYEHKQITLHPRCSETSIQWTDWQIVNNRPKPGYPLCETLLIMSSELRELREVVDDVELKPYGRQKNRIRETLYKEGYEGMWKLMKQGVNVERPKGKGRVRGPNDYLI